MSSGRPVPAVIEALRQQVDTLTTRVRDLEARLNQNSSNSSRPPSSDPPWKPKPNRRKPSGRKPGGQPGHPGHERKRVPLQEGDVQHEYVPETCEHCRATIPVGTPLAEDERVHQVFELPEIRPQITEHVRRACRCPACGKQTWAPLPPEAPASGYGPRAHATAAWLTGKGHLSRRHAWECLTEVFHLPLALGTLGKLERRVSQALTGAYEVVTEAVRAAPVVHSDETRWREGETHRWLWVLAAPRYCLLRITAHRNRNAFTALLGKEPSSRTVVSDRYGVYGHLEPAWHGYCWSHLDRDFLAVAQSADPLSFLGDWCLASVDAVFAAWRRFREGALDRLGLQEALVPVQQQLRACFSWGADAGGPKLAGFFGNLLGNWESLWVFAHTEGVESTNNLAERLLRPGVRWRKTRYGSQSEAGCRYAERLLTVTGTLALQGRSVFEFLLGTCRAAVGEGESPSLELPPLPHPAPLPLPRERIH
jgi:transposase